MSAKSGEAKLFSYEELVICLEISTPVCTELTRAGTALKKTIDPVHMQVFWIPPNVAHVALLHTASVRQDLVPMVTDAFGAVASGVEPFTVRLKGLTLREEEHEGEKRTRAIWAGVENAEPLVALREALTTALGDLDVQNDPDPYLPHVPLALVDSFRNTREFSSAFVEWQDREFGEFEIKAVTVKKANPKEGTAEQPFTVIKELPVRQA